MKTLLIAALSSLIFLLPAHGQVAAGEGDPIVYFKPKPVVVKPINAPIPPPQEPLQPVEVAPTPTYSAPAVQAAPAAATGAVNCGSDPMMAYIYTVESGCRTWAINPGGCIGLGQACPGGKLPCSLYDWTCQDNWFRNYAVAAYGSIYNAYIFRQAHNWW